MTLEQFFGKEAQARVEEAIRVAEARTIGEIVPVVVERSGRYPETPWLGAAIAAALTTAVAAWVGWPATVVMLPLVQAAAGIAGAILARIPALERLLAGGSALQAAAHTRAELAFYQHSLHRTVKETGVLVFASLFERHAVVVGDRAIHDKMGDAEWARAVDALIAGIRRNDPAGGFCDSIGICGAKLAEHFPKALGDPGNELADGLRQEKS